MLANGRCQVRAVLALPDHLPCLHSTNVALRGIPIAPGKAHPGGHQSTTHRSSGIEEKGDAQENPKEKAEKSELD